MFIELHGIKFSRGTPHPYVVGVVIPTEENHDVFKFMDVAIAGDRTILTIDLLFSQRTFPPLLERRIFNLSSCVKRQYQVGRLPL